MSEGVEESSRLSQDAPRADEANILKSYGHNVDNSTSVLLSVNRFHLGDPLSSETRRFPLSLTPNDVGIVESQVVKYTYRPFDTRWLYWEAETKLLDRKREDYFSQVREGNLWIEARQKQPMSKFDRGHVTRYLADNFGNGLSSYFPLLVFPPQVDLFSMSSQVGPTENLSPTVERFLAEVGGSALDLFRHCIAILRSPAYGDENAGGLRQDWPRVPLPAVTDHLGASAALGKSLGALLDPEQSVLGVTEGLIRSELSAVGVIHREGGGSLNPAAGELALAAGWGHAGAGGVTMPARGRAVERDFTVEEKEAIKQGAAGLGMSETAVLDCLGATTFDVYLNDVAYWCNVPAEVWRYTLGGYQVIKKWLPYREKPLLGRDLKPEEVREATNIACRIAAISCSVPRWTRTTRQSNRQLSLGMR